MSPDLRSAKVFVSVFGGAVEKRQAYSWMVEHSRAMKHSLSQSLSNMKGVPDVHFKLTDLAAATDVMATIDRLAGDSAYVGEDGAWDEESPSGLIGGLDFDFDDSDFDSR